LDKHIAELHGFIDDLGEQNTLTDVERWLRGYARHRRLPDAAVEGFLVTLRVPAVL
jgi:hypothetical protein